MAEVWYRFTDIDYLNMTKADKWGMKKTAEMLTWVTIEEDSKFENLTTVVKFQVFDNTDRDFKDQLSGAFYRIMQLYIYSLYCGYMKGKVSPDYLRELACQPEEIDRLTNISITQAEFLEVIKRNDPGLSDKLRKYLRGEIRVGRDDSLKKHIYDEYASDELKASVESAKSESRSAVASKLSKGRNEQEKSMVKVCAESILDSGCLCWHKLVSKRVYDEFVENGQVNEKGMVLGIYSKKGVRDIVRDIYRVRKLDDLIYDLQTHGGRRSECDLHSTQK